MVQWLRSPLNNWNWAALPSWLHMTACAAARAGQWGVVAALAGGGAAPAPAPGTPPLHVSLSHSARVLVMALAAQVRWRCARARACVRASVWVGGGGGAVCTRLVPSVRLSCGAGCVRAQH